MSKDMEKQPRNVVATSYSELKQSYSNQSSLQLTSVDISMQFGIISIDEEGKEFIKMENSISMSYNHFEKFITNCNKVLEDIKEKNAK